MGPITIVNQTMRTCLHKKKMISNNFSSLQSLDHTQKSILRGVFVNLTFADDPMGHDYE